MKTYSLLNYIIRNKQYLSDNFDILYYSFETGKELFFILDKHQKYYLDVMKLDNINLRLTERNLYLATETLRLINMETETIKFTRTKSHGRFLYKLNRLIKLKKVNHE